MEMKEIYADFNDFDENGNLALTCAGSVRSIDSQKEPLQDGEEVCFSDGDVRAIGRYSGERTARGKAGATGSSRTADRRHRAQVGGRRRPAAPDGGVLAATDGTVIESLHWTYDSAGNLLEQQDRRDKVAPTKNRSQSYAYDNHFARTRGVNCSLGLK
jgi:uncharacterized protein RhaS with RHS repeats